MDEEVKPAGEETMPDMPDKDMPVKVEPESEEKEEGEEEVKPADPAM